MMKRVDLVNLSLVLCTGVMLLWGGCSHESDDIPGGPPTTAIGLIKEAWDDYVNGDFGLATNKFSQVLNRDATITEAYVGLGWSYTASGTFDKALDNFFFAQARPDWADFEADVYAGMASNYAASREDSVAVIYARKTLDVDSDWVFPADPSLNADDLRVLIAQSYFKARMYLDARDEVDVMDPGWSADFDTLRASRTISDIEVVTDSTWAFFRLPQAGISEVVSVVSETAVASALVAGKDNVGSGAVSDVTAGETARTEYWVVTCKTEVGNGGIFDVVGSGSGPQADYDITTGRYTSDNGEVSFMIRDGREDFDVGDSFTFATSAANTPLTIDQIKEGNRVFISGTTFFPDVSYGIRVEYTYFTDFGGFLVQLMEKINSLYQ